MLSFANLGEFDGVPVVPTDRGMERMYVVGRIAILCSKGPAVFFSGWGIIYLLNSPQKLDQDARIREIFL